MRKFLLFMTLFLWGTGLYLQGQTTVTIGTGTTTGKYPIPGWYGWNKEIMLYKSSEIGAEADALIKSIGFYVTAQSTGTNTTRSIKIYLMQTTEEILSNQYIVNWNTIKPQATLVYEESGFGIPEVDTWHTFTLNEDYAYSCDNNLLVLIEGTGCTLSGGCEVNCRTTTSETNMFWYSRKDSSAPTGDETGAVSTSRPNIQIVMEQTGECFRPGNAVISNVLTNSATLSWNAPSILPENGYEVYVSTSGEKPGYDAAPSYSVSAGTLTQILGELDHNTLYYTWVRSVCEEGVYSNWSNMVSFYTKQSTANIPYYQNFEQVSENSNWTLLNEGQTNKWFIGSISGVNYGDGTKGMYISNNNGLTNRYSMTATSYVYAYRTINFDENNRYNIKFNWKSNGESSNDIVRAFLVPESVDLTAGNSYGMAGTTNTVPQGWIALTSTLNGQTSWQSVDYQLVVDGTAITTGKYNLVFFWKNNASSGTNPPAAIDNITVTKEECSTPLNLVLSSVDSNSAEISWGTVNNTATAWNIVVSETAITDFTGIVPTISNHTQISCTLSSLNAQTGYYAYVQSICGENITSNWSSALTFTTTCGVESVPYFEDFSANIFSTTSCWQRKKLLFTPDATMNTSAMASSTVWNRTQTESNYAAYINIYGTSRYEWLITPSINLGETENISLNFDVKLADGSNGSGVPTYGSDDKFIVLISVDNGETWEPSNAYIWSSVEGSTYDYRNLNENYQNVSIPLTGITGTIKIAFYGESTISNADDYLFIDNISIINTDICQSPYDIYLSSLNFSSLSLKWSGFGNSNRYNIIVSETEISDFTDVEHTESDYAGTSYTATGLSSGTPYYIYIQSICEANVSEWSEAVVFTTLHASSTLPYTCAFDDPSENIRWTILNQYNANDKWHIGSTTEGTHPVSDGMYITSDNGVTNNYISDNAFLYAYRSLNFAEAGEYKIKYDWRCKGEGSITDNYDHIRVFLVPSDSTIISGQNNGITVSNVPSGWIDIGGVLVNNRNWTTVEREINITQARAYNLVFVWKTDGSNNGTSTLYNPPAAIDNIEVSGRLCDDVTGLTAANITYNSADLSWTAGSYEAWNIIISETQITDFSSVTPTVSNHTINSYSVTGLDEASVYYAYVQGVCEGYANWTGVSFETEVICEMPVNINVANIAENSAVISWQAGGTETTWNIIISDVAINDFEEIVPTVSGHDQTSYNVSGLSPSTIYYVYLQSDCEENVTSEWTSYVSFGTLCGLVVDYPYFEGFNEPAMSSCWTVYDIDADGYKWEPNSSYKYEGDRSASIRYNSTINNDWLISPKFKVIEGLTIEFWAKSSSSSWREDFNVLASKTGNNTSDFTIVLDEIRNTTYSDWIKYKYVLTEVSEDIQVNDEIFIAVQYISPNRYFFSVDAFRAYIASVENDILTFVVPNQMGDAVINTENHTITVEVGYGIDLTSLAPAIGISDYAVISPASGVTQDFTSPVAYTVTSESGAAQEWTVTITNSATPSNENDILTFDFPGKMGDVNIDTDNHTINAQLRFDLDLSAITPVFTISDYATVEPASGISQDFTTTFTYAVKAQDETIQNWTINIVNATVPVGGNETNPIIVDFATAIPYTVTEQTTCNLGNVVTSQCITATNSGQEAIYRLDLDDDYYTTFELSASGSEPLTYSLYRTNIIEENRLMCKVTTGSANSSSISLYAGTYYLVVDINRANDACLSNYNLSISVEDDACVPVSNLTIDDLIQQGAVISWTRGFIETEWNIKYGVSGFDIETGGTLISGVSSNPYTITGMQENTLYDVYVQPTCGANWSQVLTLRTLLPCPMPVDVVVSNIAQDEAVISWNGYTASEWDIIVSETVLLDPDLYSSPESVSSETYNAQSLSAGTTYYVYLRANCGSGEYSYWTYATEFTTLQTPASIPYTFGFEETQENANWITLNGDQENRWYIGNAVNNGGSKGLYISNSNGTANTYANNIISYTYAYRTFDFPTDDMAVVSFDYKLTGESSYDVLNVYLIPEATILEAGNAYNMTGSSNTPPTGWIKVNNSPLSGVSTWTSFSNRVAIPNSGSYNLVFFWKNDGGGGSNPPAAVDNLVVRLASNEKNILTFGFSEDDSPAVINSSAYTVDAVVVYNVSRDNLVPAITVSENATISPATGEAQDFTSPVTYTVTAENGTIQDWLVTVTNALSPENDMLTFTLTEQECDATINADNHAIIIAVENGTDVTNLSPEFTISPLATVSPASGAAQDFTNPVTYNVTAEIGTVQPWTVTVVELPALVCPSDMDVTIGTTAAFAGHSPAGGTFSGEGVDGNTFDATSLGRGTYVVTYSYTEPQTGCVQTCQFNVTVKSNENDITAFTITDQLGNTIIDVDNHTVLLGMAAGTDVTALSPVITVSDYATVSPASGTAQDFTNPVTYAVTAENGVVQNWTASVVVVPAIVCPADMDVTIGTTVAFTGHSPAGGTFSGEGVSGNSFDATSLERGTYVVTYSYTEPQTGYLQTCQFNVTVKSDENDITAFTITDQSCESTLSTDGHTVILGMPNGTDVTALSPVITVSDHATVLPASGTAQDFTNPVTYVVTAENGVSQNWTVTVVVLPALVCPSDMDVTIGTTAEFTGHSPAGGTFSGEGVSGNSFDATSLERGTYAVTYSYTESQTGCEQTCQFNVTVKSDENSISTFTLTDQVCEPTYDVANHSIIVGMPNGTNVTALSPVITVSDHATVSPASGTAQDFTNPVTYVVTAENGVAQNWTVTVKVLPQVTCPANMTVLRGSTTQFEGYSPAGGTFSGEGVSGNSFNATGLSDGEYTITYTYTDEETGCEQSCEFTVSINVSVKPITSENMQIYPNPNSGRFFINFGSLEGNITYQISDATGSIINEEQILISNNGLKEVSLDLVPSVYYVKVISGQKAFVEKFIVQ